MLEQIEEEIEVKYAETDEYLSQEFVDECVDSDMMSTREAGFILGWRDEGSFVEIEEE